MSALGEQVLIQRLTDDESMATLAREGLDPICVPTEELREIYEWAVEVYHRGGRIQAPSVAVLRQEWGDVLDDHEIDLEVEPEGTIEWAIDDLKGSYVYHQVASFNKRLASAMAEANTQERVEIIHDYSSELVALSTSMQSQESRVDMRESIDDRLQEYEKRKVDKGYVYGMRFGLDQIDEYTRGIHPGELAVLAAGPKVGKSYLLAKVALSEWKAGRATSLYTLENSVEMTQDRIISLATGIEPRMWQQAECSEEELEKVHDFRRELKESDVPLGIFQPEPGRRTVEAIIRDAQMLETESLLIDQLTFLEVENERQARHLQIRELTHKIKTMISTGRDRMPCLLAHQISREGVRQADKLGYLDMTHLAEGSEVERTADWAFGIHRSKAETSTLKAKFQTLAVRREDFRHFMLRWSVDTGHIWPLYEMDLETGLRKVGE